MESSKRERLAGDITLCSPQYYEILGDITKWRQKCQHYSERLRGPDQPTILNEIAANHENYLFALNSCFQTLQDITSLSNPPPNLPTTANNLLKEAQLIIAGLSRFWWMRGHTKKVLPLVETAVMYLNNYPSPYPEVLAQFHYGVAMLYYAKADYTQSTSHYDSALQLFKRLKNRQGEADCLNGLGMVNREQRNYEQAKEMHEKSRLLYEAVRDRWGVAHALSNLGVVEYRAGRYNNDEFHSAALKIRREIQDALGEASSLNNIAALCVKNNQLDQAKELYNQSLAIRKLLKDVWGVAGINMSLGRLECQLSNFSNAKYHFSQCLQLFEEVGDPLGLAETTEGMVLLFCLEGEREPNRQQVLFGHAATLVGITDAIRSQLSAPMPTSHESDYKDLKSRIKLPASSFQACRERGCNMAHEDMLKYCLSVLEERRTYWPLIVVGIAYFGMIIYLIRKKIITINEQTNK